MSANGRDFTLHRLRDTDGPGRPAIYVEAPGDLAANVDAVTAALRERGRAPDHAWYWTTGDNAGRYTYHVGPAAFGGTHEECLAWALALPVLA